MTQKEAVKELHDRVRQCLTRHKFKTFGDILEWWHDEDFETCEMEAGEQGMSKFGTEIMWLTGQFGPKAKIDHKTMHVRRVPALKKVKVTMEDDAVVSKQARPAKKSAKKARRKKRRRRF